MALFAALLVAGIEAAPLPPPDGPYPVGFGSFEFVDPARKGVLSGDPTEPRIIPAYAWYPALTTRERGRTYFAPEEARDQGRAVERNFQFEPGELAGTATLRVASTRDAPRASGSFPLVVFSHGFFLYPAQNTVLAETLASHGYIVVSIGHIHDAVDLRLSNGWLMPTLSPPGADTALTDIVKRFTGDVDNDARVAALRAYPEALMNHRLGTSLVAWIQDTLFVASAMRRGLVPAPAARILEAADHSRLILAGMSFGGTTSASACRLIATCIAAVNLDGENFDPALFDRPVERPLLMLHSDWTRYQLWSGQSRDPTFNPNDLAYERWTEAGTSPDVVRLRLVGATHMAFTDLPLLLRGPRSIERFGTLDPDRAVSAISAATLAFLDVYAKGASRATLADALRRYPELVEHDASPIAEWARDGGRSIDLPCVAACAE